MMACQLLLFIKVKAIHFCNTIWFVMLIRTNYITNSKRIKRIIFGDAALKFSGKIGSGWINQSNSITTVKKMFE